MTSYGLTQSLTTIFIAPSSINDPASGSLKPMYPQGIRKGRYNTETASQMRYMQKNYLSYSYHLRTSKNELHLKILSRKNVVWEEIKYLKSLNTHKWNL